MKRNYRLIFYLISLFFCARLHAQVITIGTLSFTGSNFAGPANTSSAANASSRYAYIYPQTTVSALRHGDTIRSLSFHRNGGGGLSGNCNLRIFMRMTVNNNYGSKNVNWVNLTGATGMKKVYDANPSAVIDTVNTWVRFVLSAPYVVDTVLGKNLEILVEYTQASAQLTSIFWTFENSGTVSGFTSNQTKFVRSNGGTLTDTTNSSTELHPTLRIEFPRSDFDVSVNKVYSFGKLPVPQGNPDTVSAIVQNVGKKTANFKLYLVSKGANDLIDSASYSLKSLEEKVLKLPLLYPTNFGMDTLTVKMQNDQDNSNNSSVSYRVATEFMYSYKDPTRPVAGGIGFNGTTGDFVAKFFSASRKNINQVAVAISGSNQKFKIGIWKADGKNGTPKTLLWVSDTILPSALAITPVDPPVTVNGNFFVGVRQIGTVNVGFGYQPEIPVRANTFFYAEPMGDTNWVDFAPDAPFKFVIEPRIQAENDLAPISYDFPKDTLWLSNTSMMAPKATFINYGTKDQKTPFTVTMEIKRFGNLEYSSSRTFTLDSGKRKLVTFDSTFKPLNAGDYVVTLVTKLSNDQIRDNDTLKSKLVVAAFKDVGPATIFDPSYGFDYEQFIDTIFPTVYIQNYGLDKQGPFNVRTEIYDSAKNLVYSDVKSFTLTALNSILASFKPFPCDVKGQYYFRAFTELGIDVDKSNDTVSRIFRIVRSNDVAIVDIVYPANGKSLTPPVAARKPEAVLRNVGDANQADYFTSFCDIYYGTNLIYRDSFHINSFRSQDQTLLFKNFSPSYKGYYTMKVYSALPGDQFRMNDTMVSYFAVGVPDDVELISISPTAGSVLQLNKRYPTFVSIRNNGYNPQNTPFPVVFKVTQGPSIKYIKVINVTIDSGQTNTFNLDTVLMLTQLTNYQLEVYTRLGNDFIKSNDTIKGEYYTAKDLDLSLSSILYPTSNDTLLINTQNVMPKVRIDNAGDSLAKGKFRVNIRISNANTGVTFYSKFADTQLIDSNHLIMGFPAFSINTAMPVKIVAWVDYASDQFNLNDTARQSSLFMLRYDARSLAVDVPVNGKTYGKSTPQILPSVQVANFGLSTMPGFYARVIIKHVDTISLAETEVYRDSVLINGLISGMTVATDLNTVFSIKDQVNGKYYCYLDVLSDLDQVPANNSKKTEFRIDNSLGIHGVRIEHFSVYPNPTHDFITIKTHEAEALGMQVSVVDVLGQTVKCLTLDQPETKIYIDDLSPGTYFLKTDFGLIKFIVE